MGLPALANTPSFYGVLQFEPGILLHTHWASTLPTELRATPLALKTLKNLKVSTHKEEDRRNRKVGGHVDTDWQTGSAENLEGHCVSGSGVKVK